MQPDRIPEDIKDAVQWRHRSDVSSALKGWEVVTEYKHDTVWRLGCITFQHSVPATVASDKDLCYDYGTPYGLLIRGHTHRPMRVTQCQERKSLLPYWYANPGCGAEWDRMHYMDRCSRVLWGRGCIVGELPESSVRQSRTAYAAKNWDAELRVHSTARD